MGQMELEPFYRSSFCGRIYIQIVFFSKKLGKVENILKGSLDSIPSNYGQKSLLTSPSNVLPY